MRKTQIVYIESYDGDFVCDVIKIEAIVLTPEQHKEDLRQEFELIELLKLAKDQIEYMIGKVNTRSSSKEVLKQINEKLDIYTNKEKV